MDQTESAALLSRRREILAVVSSRWRFGLASGGTRNTVRERARQGLGHGGKGQHYGANVASRLLSRRKYRGNWLVYFSIIITAPSTTSSSVWRRYNGAQPNNLPPFGHSDSHFLPSRTSPSLRYHSSTCRRLAFLFPKCQRTVSATIYLFPPLAPRCRLAAQRPPPPPSPKHHHVPNNRRHVQPESMGLGF